MNVFKQAVGIGLVFNKCQLIGITILTFYCVLLGLYTKNINLLENSTKLLTNKILINDNRIKTIIVSTPRGGLCGYNSPKKYVYFEVDSVQAFLR